MSFQNFSVVSNELKYQFQNFLHMDKESLNCQYNRFVVLIRIFQDSGIQLDNSNMIMKFLDSLPRGLNWSCCILSIKREENLNSH